MSGQQEQRDGREQGSQPEQSDQPGQLDGALVMAQSSLRGQDRANGHVRTIGTAARTTDADPYLAIGETAGRHRSARSLFDPAPPADPAPAAVAEPANQADTTGSRTETAEPFAPPAAESTADSRPQAGATDTKPSARAEPEREAGTGHAAPAANLTSSP